MKKMFVVFSVLMAITLVAAPSYALMGIDDPVNGTDFIVPFIVEMPIGGTGLDTSIMVQEVSGNPALGGPSPVAKAVGSLHWTILSPVSAHILDRYVGFTAGDVVTLSVRALLTPATAGQLAQLEVDLNSDGVADHYAGYLYGQNMTTAIQTDNLYAMFYYADLLSGRASGSYAAMKEFVGVPPVPNVANFAINGSNAIGFVYEQCARANPNGTTGTAAGFWTENGTNTRTDFQNVLNTGQAMESFSPAAYFYTAYRQLYPGANGVFNVGVPRTSAALLALTPNLNFVEFTPRWYFYNANAESYIILWKNRNHNQVGVNNLVTVNIWSNDERFTSLDIPLPSELNIIRMRDYVPADYISGGANGDGGWVDIRIADAGSPFTHGFLQNWRYTEFLIWTWTIASDAAATNWASLWNDRTVGTLGVNPRW